SVSWQRATARPKVSITLSQATPGWSVPGSEGAGVSSIRLLDCGSGIFSIHIAASNPARNAIAGLLQALARVQQEGSIKVLMLSGIEHCFPGGGREAYNEAVEQGLYRAIVSFPYPVIAVVKDDAIGAGFMAATLCDLMVLNEDASYGCTDGQRHFYPTGGEAMLFSERLGDVLAQDFLYVSPVATGRQLRAKGWTCPMAAGEQVEAYAEKLGSTLATKSQEALRLLKQHLTRSLAGWVEELRRVEAAEPALERPTDQNAETMASPSGHIRLETPAENVLLIKLGVAGKQVGAKERVAELGHLFARIQEAGCYKAIVLVSEDPDFVAGTEGVIAGDVVLELQRLLVESPIPVVAALAGDAKGHGWLISQLCDACVYSQTGVYSSADMGSSPVVAQTAAAVFTQRLGNAAGKEILFSGAEYRGVDLQRRVGTLLVAEQDQVLPRAVQVAESWAKLPRATLTAWKQHSAGRMQSKASSLQAGAQWGEKDEAPGPLAAAPAPIPLRSKVVTATAYAEGIVVVKMEDREARNMFSEALVEGVT